MPPADPMAVFDPPKQRKVAQTAEFSVRVYLDNQTKHTMIVQRQDAVRRLEEEQGLRFFGRGSYDSWNVSLVDHSPFWTTVTYDRWLVDVVFYVDVYDTLIAATTAKAKITNLPSLLYEVGSAMLLADYVRAFWETTH